MADNKTAKVQSTSQDCRCDLIFAGCSSIRPVIINVTAEINRNANGSATTRVVSATSFIIIMPANPTKIKNDIIINDVNTFWTCLVSIVRNSFMNSVEFQQSKWFKKIVTARNMYHWPVFTKPFISRSQETDCNTGLTRDTRD